LSCRPSSLECCCIEYRTRRSAPSVHLLPLGAARHEQASGSPKESPCSLRLPLPQAQDPAVEHLRLLLVSEMMEPDIPGVDQDHPQRSPIPGLLHVWLDLLIEGARHLLVALTRDHDVQRTHHQQSVQHVPLLLEEPQTLLKMCARRSRIA